MLIEDADELVLWMAGGPPPPAELRLLSSLEAENMFVVADICCCRLCDGNMTEALSFRATWLDRVASFCEVLLT